MGFDASNVRRKVSAAWLVPALVAVVAVGRAATVAPMAHPAPVDEATRRGIFVSMAAEERKMRREAAKDFPADPWSQDDAFHNLEYKRAKTMAGERGISIADVLRAEDEGMRRHWPRPSAAWLNPSVPPCRPRPIH